MWPASNVGSPVVSRAVEDFHHIMLDVNGHTSLLECLDAYFSLCHVEYTTPMGFKTSAASESLIDAPPYVLSLQLKVR